MNSSSHLSTIKHARPCNSKTLSTLESTTNLFTKPSFTFPCVSSEAQEGRVTIENTEVRLSAHVTKCFIIDSNQPFPFNAFCRHDIRSPTISESHVFRYNWEHCCVCKSFDFINAGPAFKVCSTSIAS